MSSMRDDDDIEPVSKREDIVADAKAAFEAVRRMQAILTEQLGGEYPTIPVLMAQLCKFMDGEIR